MLSLAAVAGPQGVAWSRRGAVIERETGGVGERKVGGSRFGLSIRDGGKEKGVSLRWPSLRVPSPTAAASSRYRRPALPEEGVAVEDPVTEEPAVEEPVSQEPSAFQGPTVKVRFELQRECHFGQEFSVVGDDPQFGNWEPTAAVPLNWSEGHVWVAEVDVLEGKQIEFKYVLRGKDGETEWQPGPNLVLETAAGSGSLLVSEPWDVAQPETTSDQPYEPATQSEEPVDDEPAVRSPGDALAEAAASAAVGALSAGVKTAAAVEGGMGAVTPLSDPDGERNRAAKNKDQTPTAVEVPVLDAALAAAAEEVRGESKETEEATSNDS